MKQYFIAAMGACGTAIAGALGGWDQAAQTLVAFMAIDYMTGVIAAGVFHKSQKSDTGGLKSDVGFKGLLRKGLILLVVVVANMLDAQTGSNYIRDGVCIAYISNEAVSIFENLVLMGVPVPGVIKNALDLLNAKNENA